MKHIYLSLIVLLCATAAFAAETDSISSKKAIGNFKLHASVNTSYILPTNEFLRGCHDNKINLSPDIRASFRFGPSTKFGRLYPGVSQGLGISPNIILPKSSFGHPVNIYLFQDIRLLRHGRWSLNAEWNFGISAGWRHFDEETNPENTAIGSNVNAMLGLGLSATYQINKSWALRATANAIHFSNGNTHLPNSGVNTAGIQIGAVYTFDQLPEINSHIHDTSFKPGFEYDLAVYGATRRRIAADSSGDNIVVPGKFGVVGLNFAPMYAVNRFFRAGISADFQYDESANIYEHLVEGTYGDEVKFYRQSFAERFSAGLSLRAELTFPIFSVNIGLGRNLIAKGSDTRIFYQTLTLKAYVWRNSYLQVGYQLSEFHLPNNLMLGIGYTFNRKR